MKTISFLLLLLTCHMHAETAAAESSEFSVVLGCARSVADVSSSVFPVDVRNKGGVGSVGSAEFALDTTNSGSGWLEVIAPANVASGSVNPVLVTWHYGTNSTRTVTSQVRWVFRSDPAGGSYFSGGELHAGTVAVPTSMTVFAVYETIGGFSRESAPVTINVLPGLLGKITASRQGTTGQVTYTATDSGGSGTTTIRWDTNHDNAFDDGIGTAITVDYGTTTGTKSVYARITDGAGGDILCRGLIILNKPLETNQPDLAKKAFDPAGFDLFNDDAGYTNFSPDPALKDNGLVVIVHGLKSDAKQPWLRDMAYAIEQRCPASGKPNIALMDWSRDAADPAPVDNDVYKAEIISSIGFALRKHPALAIAEAASPVVADFVGDFPAVRGLGLLNGQLLASWIYNNSQAISGPMINVDKPIHLIGHSAGGFVVGEAARLLKHPGEGTGTALRTPIYVDRVTLLDTPFPERSHLVLADKAYPLPGTVERFNSSLFGNLDFRDTRNLNLHTYYRQRDVRKSSWPSDYLSPGDNGHGYAHEWYTDKTIGPWIVEDSDGFSLSPIINPATRIAKPYGMPLPAPAPKSISKGDAPQSAPSDYPDIVPTGWEIFGNASASSGTWTLSESADAGIWKEMTLPQTAATLAFEFHFLTAGDGDFLAVHFGDNPVLYQGLDLPLSRDAWLPAEIPLDLLPQGALSGKLVFTLVSRGGVNAQVQIRNIRIIQSEDADSDGLTVDQETAAGSDPRNPDSDGDGISDGDEVITYGIDPNRADSDGDGQADASELAAGTNPLANGSLLRVTSTVKSGGDFVLNWSGVAGKTYRVLRSQELGTSNFETLAFGVAGAAPTTTFNDPAPPQQRAFYWIEVE